MFHDSHTRNLCHAIYRRNKSHTPIAQNSFCSKHQEKLFSGIYQQLSEALINVVDDMLEYQVLSRFGYAKLIQNHYSSMRRYFTDFIRLPFLIEKGGQSLEQSIDLVRKLDKQEIAYGELDALLTKTASIELVIEQFDQMVRVAASLKKKLSPAHEVIRRLSKGAPSDKLSKAFTQLGRILKTEYILQYITDSNLRDKVQRQLNKGEHRHQLARCIFFANQGKFQAGDYEEIMNKASCLSLVSNAVLYWNTMKMTQIIAQLKNNGEVISDNTLTHISLLPHKHLITMGTYFTDTAIEQPEVEDMGEFTVLEQI